MAATVIHSLYASGKIDASTNYPNGKGARVDDGHLMVLDYNGGVLNKVIGVYAPGSWVAFSVDGQSAVVDKA